MPQSRSSQKPPEAMTSAKRWMIVIVAGIFDAMRLFFTMFWFFGPALAAAACTHTASGLVGSLWGLTEKICEGGAVAAGLAVSEITIPFGIIMSMVVGFIGFLTLGLWILLTNSRLFKTVSNAPLQFVGVFAASEIPVIGAIPVFAIVLWRLYGTQMKIEQATLEKWNAEHAQEIASQRRAQQQQAAQILLARNAHEEQIQEQEEQEYTEEEAAEEEGANETEAADDYYDEIPDEVREAA